MNDFVLPGLAGARHACRRAGDDASAHGNLASHVGDDAAVGGQQSRRR